ncbi:AraC family transcriptional regulator ligand-binding domain-containing protein [Pseudomonas poae]|nr:AraC family transcriptional regulator ligand-binding domain-containing protein [Pseudomonas poae]
MPSIFSPFAHACIEAVTATEKGTLSSRIPARPAKEPGARNDIPLTHLNQLLTLAQQRQNNEDIGLLAYQKAHPGNLGVLGYAIMSSATVLDALKHMVEHHSTIGLGFCMFLDEQPCTVTISGGAANPQIFTLPRVFIDAVTSMTLGLLHWLVPKERIVPLCAGFTYPRPENVRQLEELFGHRIAFSAATNSLTFSRSDCELSISTFDPSLQSIHTSHLKMQQRALEIDDTSAQTKRVILKHLHEGKSLTMEGVLKSMSLTQRQLTRALKTQGVSFQNLVDEIKRTHSSDLLTHTTLSFKQIAYSVGFKNQSAFNKACERWFGMSPGNHRAAYGP